MKLRILGAALCTFLLLPTVLYAQDTTVIGTVKDATDAVLPGVTVTALNLENGNTFVDVSDAAGNYRLAVRPGLYKITADLAGFTPAVRDKIELLLGQRAVLDLRLTLSGVAENITVTGEAPLVDTSTSRIGGNIDRRQVEDLPVNGRNFVDLSLLAPGSRSNAVTESMVERSADAGQGGAQINVDGQQVTQMAANQNSFGNPRYSKDSIAEFEVITNRFDATQGHSSGGLLNAITKSGTNRFAGSVSGYFRDDRFNAEDFIVHRVLPYQDQQISTTFGGPILRDRFHFFANYEYERTPQTFIYTTPYPSFNQDQTGTETVYTTGLKLDYQVNSSTHAMLKGYRYHRFIPYDPVSAGGSTRTPSGAGETEKASDSLFGTLTQTFGSRAVNEVKGGYSGYFSRGDPRIAGAPTISLLGLTFGGPNNFPQRWIESRYTLRDDLTLLFSKVGRHELKIGAEFLHNNLNLTWYQTTNGQLTANGGPIPANIEELFPSQSDWSTWNLAPLSPVTIRWAQSFGTNYFNNPANLSSAWIQENWTVTSKLTLNLGLRYEYSPGILNEDAVLLPFLDGEREAAKLDFMPRLGGAYTLNGGKTVFRGGWGKYLAQNSAQPNWATNISILTRIPSFPNDGRPNFAADPYNGRRPTVAEVFAGVSDTTSNIISPDSRISFSWQASAGLQQQIGETMSLQADYVYQGGRNEFNSRNYNLTYDPVTGVNYPFNQVARRRIPNWGIVGMLYSDGISNYHGLQTALNKRFSSRWQGTVTYALSQIKDQTPCPAVNGLNAYDGVAMVPCPIDIGNDYTLAATDQRHRATANGIWSLPYDFQLSGLYFFGSGQMFNTSFGGDRRLQGVGSSGRLAPDGSIVPRSNLTGDPIHRVDLRIMKRVNLVGTARLDGILEVFNLFNHANYGSYVSQTSNRLYGQPQQNIAVAYQPRIMQLGFRLTF